MDHTEITEPSEFRGLRCYRDGRVERKFKRKGWTIVENTANHNEGYNQLKVGGENLLRQRLMMAAFNPNFDITKTDHLVDHRDENKLNNAYENLRVTTNQGNQWNVSSVKGYSWDKRSGRWKASIKTADKQQKHLGYFKLEEDARAAYLAAKEKYHVIEELC